MLFLEAALWDGSSNHISQLASGPHLCIEQGDAPLDPRGGNTDVHGEASEGIGVDKGRKVDGDCGT